MTTFSYVEQPGPGTSLIGDRLIKTTQNGQDTLYEYNSVGDITKINAPGGEAADTTYGYDDFGRRTTSNGPGAAGDESYAYDALDRRDSKTKNAKNFDYADVGLTEKLSREQTGVGSESRTYDYDSQLMRIGQSRKASISTDATYRSYATDANGSVEGLEDATGGLAASDTYQYDPYGELQNTPSGDAADAPFRFEGFYLDIRAR